MFPHVDDLPQETSMWLAWSGQDTVMSHHIWYTIDWLGTQQYKWPVSVSRSRVLLSLLTFPQASPEPSHHRGGWAWLNLFFLTPNTWFFHQPSNSQHRPPIVHWLLISYLWSQGPCHRLRYQDSPDIRCQPCGSRHSYFWPSNWKWEFPWPHLHAQYHIELATELRKTYTYCPQNNIQEKTQKQCNGRAMEGKERVQVWGAFMPQRTAPSHHHHWSPPISSLNARIYGVLFFNFDWGFLQQGYWLNLWAVMTDLNPSALPSPYRWRSCKPWIPLLIMSANPFSPWNILVPIKDKNSKIFRTLGPWTRKRIKYG